MPKVAGFAQSERASDVQAVGGAEVIAAVEVGVMRQPLVVHRWLGFTVEVGEEVGDFVDADAVEVGVGDLAFEAAPDGDRDVFGGWDGVGEVGDFEVEVAMIVDADDFAFRGCL